MSEKVSIVEEAKAYVKEAFKSMKSTCLHYHNWKHVKMVHASAVEIMDADPSITPEQREAMELATYFHDVAYDCGWEGHEERGAKVAEDFLKERAYPEPQIDLVKQLILATEMKRQPEGPLEGLIKDADLAHIANPDYVHTTFMDLYNELVESKMKEMNLKEWAVMCLEFIGGMDFHTEYARKNYGPGKEENLKLMKAMAAEEIDEQAIQEVAVKKKKKGKKKDKEDIPEKGIETMFRVSLRNHVTLSRIADVKANTLISVNAIIISIVLSTLFPKMDSNEFLIYPGIALLGFSILTIIISILSTIPNTTHGKMTRQDVDEKRGNLLFFGNFHGMSLDDYEWGIGELMRDKDYLYKSLTRDLYFLGKVLTRKYSLLRYSYYTFVIGLVISIGLFVSSLLMYQAENQDAQNSSDVPKQESTL